MGELNKILGKDFIIGFFLPALIFITGNYYLLGYFGISMTWVHIDWTKPIEDMALLGLLSWVFGVFLQAFNRELFRMAEGYWPFGLQERCNSFQRWRFRVLHAKISKVELELNHCESKALEAAREKELSRLSKLAAYKYPSKESLVLPTSFGNVVRAFEDYSRVVYSFESIQGWARLQALISKDFREMLGAERARVDLWLNLFYLAIVCIIELEILFSNYGPRTLFLWLPLSMLGLVWLSYERAKSSAAQHGELVKAAFDVYLPQLASKLGYELSSDLQNNRKFWRALSQTMVYRDFRAAEDMARVGLRRSSPKKEDAADGDSGDDADD